jgi:hypothetical protein
MSAEQSNGSQARKSWLNEIIQPFIDLCNAPRALMGINLAYLIEGMVYFGVLGYLSLHFSDFIFKGVEEPDVHAHHMVMVLTAASPSRCSSWVSWRTSGECASP